RPLAARIEGEPLRPAAAHQLVLGVRQRPAAVASAERDDGGVGVHACDVAARLAGPVERGGGGADEPAAVGARGRDVHVARRAERAGSGGGGRRAGRRGRGVAGQEGRGRRHGGGEGGRGGGVGAQ